MGLTQSISDQIIDLIKQDKAKDLHAVLTKNKIALNEFIQGGRTGIVLCSLYDSIKCLKIFIELGNDINIVDAQDGNTPLIIASKFNFISFTQTLIEHAALVEIVNLNGFNAFDIAFLRGNYEICYYFYTNNILSPKKTLENYIALHEQLKYPLFQIELFYNTLMNKIPIDNAPSFKVIPKRRKELEGKIPDPNESWGSFAKRLWRMELYQPPLVDANSIDNKNTLYMRMQTGLVEMEYDVNIDLKLKKNKTQDIELNEQEIKEKVNIKFNEENINENQLILNQNYIHQSFDTPNEINLPNSSLENDIKHQLSSPMSKGLRNNIPPVEDCEVIQEIKSEERKIAQKSELMNK